MSQTAFSNIEAVLKQIEDNEIAIQFNNEALFMSEVVDRKSGLEVNMKGYAFTNEFSPDTSHAFISEGGANPAGGSNEYVKSYVGITRYRKSIELTNDAYLDLHMGKDSSILSFAQKVQRATASAVRELEEQAWGDGTGVKAVVGTGSTTTSIVPTVTPTTTPFTSKGAEFIYKGVAYDCYDSSGVLKEANIVPTAVDKDSVPAITVPTMSYNAPVTTDVLVLKDSYNKALRGLRYLLGNGSGLKQGLLQSSYPELKTPQEDLAGAPLQPSTILKLRNKIRYRGGVKAGKGLMIVGPLAQVEAYARTGFNFLRFQPGQTWDGVVDKVQMGGTSVMELTTPDEDTLWFINGDDLGKIQRRPLGFIQNGTGQTFYQKSGSNGTGSDAVHAQIGWDGNLFVKKPNSHGVIVRAAVTGLATAPVSRD